MKRILTILIFIFSISLSKAQTPVAYYKLNGNAADSSGNSLHGAIIGSPTFTTDRNGNANSAIEFNGNVANRIEVADNILLHTPSLTITSWVKLNNTSGLQTLVDKPLSPCINDSWHYGTENNVYSTWVSRTTGCGDFAQATTSATTNQWTFYAVTIDDVSDQIKLYIDGVLKSTVSYTGTIPYDANPMMLGAALENNGLAFPLNGSLDEVKIFNGALTASQIQAEFNATQSTSLAVKKPGSGNAIRFDGVDDFIEIPNQNATLQDFTLEYWIKNTTSSEPAFERITEASDPASGTSLSFITGKSSSQIKYFTFNSQWVDVCNIGLNQWVHLSFVRQGGSFKVYQDGIQVFSSNISTTPIPVNWRIGRAICCGAGEFAQMDLDEFRIWNSALTQSQIRDRICRKITSTDDLFSNLVTYYNFDETSGTTVFDGTANNKHGTLNSSPARITSGAAIGNASVHDYVNTTKTANLSHASGENFSVTSTSGNPTAVHIYRVDEAPNTTNGLITLTDSSKYFGVFQVGGSSPQYSATYSYSGHPSVTINNESNLRLYKRADNTTTTWTIESTVPNESANTITLSGQNTEYILGQGSSGSVCGCVSENSTLNLTAPVGSTFNFIEFASYGLPQGNCSSGLSIGSCHASTSMSVVQAAFLNKNTATIGATNSVFGDPCVGIFKALCVRAHYGNTVLNSAGTISGNQTICSNETITTIQSTQDAQTSTAVSIQYQWQDSVSGGVWQDISGASSNIFLPTGVNGTKFFRRKVTIGSFIDFTNVVTKTVTAIVGNPSVFGTNQWNVYAYNGADITLGSGSGGVATRAASGGLSGSIEYRGTYTVNTLNLNSLNEWNSSLSPSAFSGFQGCSVNNDNFTWVYKRKGFTAGNYIVSSTGVDDLIKIFVNGNEIFTSSGFGPFNNITLGALNANSTVEIRCVDFASNAFANFTFTQSNLVAGVVGGNQSVCKGFVPLLLTNTQDAFGGSLTTINYQWQQSSNDTTFTNIPNATLATYQPANANTDVYYRRKASNANNEFAFSDTVLVEVIKTPAPAVTITGSNSSAGSPNNPVCFGCSVTITATTTNAGNAVFSFFQNGILKQSGTNNQFQFAPIQQDTITCVLISTNACTKDTVVSNSYIVPVIEPADLVVNAIAVQQTTINPKGKINITWNVKNIGQLNSGDGWQERISLENGAGESIFLGTAYNNNALDSGATASRQIELTVPEIVTLDGKALLKIILVPNANTTEPVLLQSNNTSFSIDSIVVNKQLLIEPSKTTIDETDATVYGGYLFRSGSRKNTESFVMKSSDTSRMILLDTLITIPTGSSGGAFKYKVKDNTILDADSVVMITAIGNSNYPSANDTLQIIDNELASLTISISKDTTNEGDTIQLTLIRQMINTGPLTVSLTSTNDSRFVYPNPVIFSSTQSSKTISVTVNKGNKPVLAESVIFTASANRFSIATDNAVIRENNIPIITLDMLPASFSESAGTQAAIAKIKRQGSTEFPVTLTITDDSNGEIFYPASSITLNKGEDGAQFFIGVNDNSIVDSSRTVKITASVFVASCGCSVSSSNAIAAGHISKQITILDNDGPSLGIELSETNLPEGKTNATIVTITRNTATTQALTVNISSDKDSQLVYNKTVIIPIGSTKVDVPVSVLSNTTSEGDRIVTFQVNASGFAGNSTWAIITDRTLPDATIVLTPLSFDSAFAKATITVKAVISNEGVINIPAGTEVSFYLSANNQANANGQLVSTISTTNPILPGQKDTITTTLQLPDKLGKQYFFAQINPNQAVAELSYINNFSNTLGLTFLPNYKFINVGSNKPVYIKGDSIIITGKAQALANVSVANVAVEVYVINNQFREAYSTVTDANGNFSFQFVPLQGQLGHFSVGACYPNLGSTNEQAGFEVLGINLANNNFIKWEINVNDTLRGQVQLINPAQIPLTKLQTAINSVSNTGWVLKFDSIPNMAAGSSVNLSYIITSNKPTATNNYEPINFTVTSFEGARLNITSYFYCRALRASLQSSLATIQTTMTKGSTKSVSLVIKNIGAGSTGNSTVALPNAPWLSLQTPVTMPSINNGDSQIVVLKLSPDASMPANIPVVGTIAINCEHGDGLVIPFSITPVSTSKGSLMVDVRDEFTYFTTAAPHVKGALVKVSDIYTNTVIAQGLTDSSGVFKADSLPDGYYKLTVTAQQHDSYTNNLLINAGEVNNVIVNLSFQAISYTWNVVPTTVKDVYNIKATLTFVTSVPVPVVVLSMPDSIPLLKNNDIFTFKAVLTNKGLITAKDVGFTLPTDNQYEFIYNYTPTDILANQSIQVPVLVKRKSPTASKTTSPVDEKCEDLVVYYYGWECGPDKKLKSVQKTITFSGVICSTPQVPPVVTNPAELPGSLGFPGGGLALPGISLPQFPFVQTNLSCDKCFNAMLDAMIGCTPGLNNLANATLCAKDVTDLKLTKKEALGCLLNFAGPVGGLIGCAIGLMDEYCACGGDGCDDINKFNDGEYGNTPLADFSSTFSKNKFSPSNLLQSNMNNLAHAFVGLRSVEFWTNEVFKGIEKKASGADFYKKVEPFITSTIKIPDSIKLGVKNQMVNTDVLPDNIESFVQRWNNSIDAWSVGVYSPDSLHPNIIDTFRLHYYDSLYQYCYDYAINKGFASLIIMYETSFKNVKDIVSEKTSSVCAAVTIQFSQTVTMTRQAFRGTFSLFNGNTTDSIKNFSLNLVIKDDQGNIAGSQKFQTTTETVTKLGSINGSGILPPSDTGTATILFIPTKNAAPIVPKQYSFGGNISYVDPFTGTVVTRDLFPVTITVNPSPDLVLDYFIQRDILGDDPLTTPVEASVPAEFSLIINNQGYGDATQVQFTTDEPKIIDNEKGLLLDLHLVGSSLNGAPTSIAFNNLDFGTINARSTMFGQWFFTSSLLGQFVNYDVNVTHVSSYNNPDLSLISAANIHQLVHTINVPSDNNSNPLGFLSTDVPNIGNNPDIIYVTNGTKQTTFVAQNASVSVLSDSTVRLTVTPLVKGWNYKSVINPFTSTKTLKRVIKENSGTNVSLRNVWLTDRTLFAGQDPIYENRIHFADDIQDSVQSYILTFNAEPAKRLAVDAIAGVPDTVSTIQITKLTVHFNKPIDSATFTAADITVRCQGIILNTGGIGISRINDSTYQLDITAVTDSNGYYSLTVQTDSIMDKEGFNGVIGFVVGWNQFTNNNLQITTVANPVGGGTINPSTSSYPFGTTVRFVAQPSAGFKFKSWFINNSDVSFDTALNHLVIENKVIVANFEKTKCLLNVVVDTAKGAVSGNASGIYESGTNITLSVTTKAGSSFLGWKVNDSLVSSGTSFTIVILKDLKIEPAFKAKTNPTITWNAPQILTCTKVLDASVLNATSSVAGNFIYAPPLGTALLDDSLYMLTVKFTPSDTVGFNAVFDTVFVATDFIKPVTNTTNVTGCDSVSHAGEVYTSNTTLHDTIRISQGCDSIYNVVNIIVKHSSHKAFDSAVCSSQLPFTWNGLTFISAGTQTAHLINAVGCDSSATLTLTVKTNSSSGNSLSICSAALPFTWNGLTFTSAGTQTAHLTNAVGCDSAATLTLTVKANSSSNNNLSICSTALPFAWNGLTFNAAGTQTAHLTNAAGCDSAATLNLTVKTATSSNTTTNICNNQLPFTWNGLTFTAAGTQTAHLTNAAGCDSAATLTVVVGNAVTPSIVINGNKSFCKYESVTYTATVTNGGSSPQYQWKKNGNNAGTGISITFAAGALITNDIISCVLTANNSCQTTATATSNNIVVTVNEAPAIGVSSIANATMCTINSTTNVSNSNTNGGGVWSSSNTSVVTVSTVSGAGGVVTAVANGTATLTYTKTSAGCTSTASVNVLVAAVATPNAITGAGSICKGTTSQQSSTTSGGVWSSANSFASVNSSSGLVTAVSAGNAVIVYTVTNSNGCSATTTKNITINAIPNVPGIGYAPGSINPQTGAGGGFCNNKTFTLAGSPAGGVWSSTGGLNINPSSGAAATVVLGPASVTYTITSNGCSNSRSIIGNVVTCASRGINTNVIASNDTKFTLYPNPAKQFVSLNIHQFIGSGNIVVTDLYGKQLKRQVLGIGTNTIDISKLAKGIYLVSVVTSGEMNTRKLVIE